MLNSSRVPLGLGVASLLVLSSFVVVTKSDRHGSKNNYVTTAELSYGEHEVHIRFGDILIREASALSHNDKGTRIGTSSRSKREIGDAFRVPGTQWCGRGFSATEMKQLGGFTGADKCCRFHDTGCPYFIAGFEEKYGLFNWRMYTINHCSCDGRFRSCLKMTNTGAANFVGKLFFNVVQTQCFVLKPDRACVRRSWWGNCLKYEVKKQARLRAPVPY